MRNFCASVVGYIDGLGLDPATVTLQDLLDIGIHYYRVPGQRNASFIPIEEITTEDIEPLWLATTSYGDDDDDDDDTTPPTGDDDSTDEIQVKSEVNIGQEIPFESCWLGDDLPSSEPIRKNRRPKPAPQEDQPLL